MFQVFVKSWHEVYLWLMLSSTLESRFDILFPETPSCAERLKAAVNGIGRATVPRRDLQNADAEDRASVRLIVFRGSGF